MNQADDAQISAFDREMMQKCLRLASRGAGKTSPNPLVGAVVVQQNEIVGEGFHPQAGQPHAEVFALRAAGEAAQGSTVYVNLEPCNHYGRTPPCTEALIEAGVAKVVVGMVDPDSRVQGKGIERLREAGIEVVVGVESEACERLNEAFKYRVLYHKPFGILKYAMTLDGKIATATGHSAWVSSTASRGQVHQLRAACDAVIVGGNTVRKDNPHLTTHGVADAQPIRTVITRHLHLPTKANLWHTEAADTWVFTLPNSNPSLQQQLQQQGVKVIHLDVLTPKTVMDYLYQQGLNQVLWECGGNLAAAAIKQGAVQKILAFIAPKIIGGGAAFSPVGDLGLDLMSQALKLKNVRVSQVDEDWLWTGYL